ncbi:MAG: PIN domain-containing protein [candidate division NC10 bacterium]|nr:PIN domain-containing protein [candidate division NC10 bacterium]
MSPAPQRAFLVDTDIFIDYLKGFPHSRRLLDHPQHRCYYIPLVRKELLQKQGLSTGERRRILTLLARHYRLGITGQIADRYSRLLHKYSRRALRPADSLIAAAAWATKLPLVTRNQKHYAFISEIVLIDPVNLKRIAREK